MTFLSPIMGLFRNVRFIGVEPMGMNGEFNFRGRNPVKIRCCQYLNNVVEQDHRRVKGRLRSMLGFKTFLSATASAEDARPMCHPVSVIIEPALARAQNLRTVSHLRSDNCLSTFAIPHPKQPWQCESRGR